MLTQRHFTPPDGPLKIVWIPDQPFASYALNVSHLVLPPGELWFCRIFNQSLSYIDDPTLKSDVKGFIHQEGMHARSHRNILQEFEQQGMDFSQSKQRLAGIFQELLGDKALARYEMRGKMVFRWLRMRVGIIAAIEHITCILGNWILDNRQLEQHKADPAMLEILQWHGAEEVEHRSVAFDLYRHLGGGYWSRNFWFVLVLLVILLTWKRGTQVFIQQAEPGRHQRYGFRAYRQASRLGLVPTASYLCRQLLRYLKPGYHPVREGSDEQARQVLSRLKRVSPVGDS